MSLQVCGFFFVGFSRFTDISVTLISHVVVLVKSFFGVTIFSFWSFYIAVQHLGHFIWVCSFFFPQVVRLLNSSTTFEKLMFVIVVILRLFYH